MIPSYLYTATFPTGSNYICNPPVTDTDIDQMFLVTNLNTTEQYLMDNGWKICGVTEYARTNWAAYRKENLNALITDDPDHFAKFYHATELAKERNLLKKEDRIELFNKICGQMTYKKKQHAETIEEAFEQQEWYNQ